MIRGVHHVAVSTPDLDRLVAFYTDLFDFEVVMRTEWKDRPAIDAIVGLTDSAARQVMLKAGNAYLEIFEYHSPTPRPGNPARPVCDHGYTHFCIDVTDIDAEFERLTTAGMHFHCPPPTFGGGPIRATYGRDPDGNVIELQEVVDTSIDVALERTGVLGDST